MTSILRSKLWQLFWMLLCGALANRYVHLPPVPGYEPGLTNALVILMGVMVGGCGWMVYRGFRP